MLPLPKKQDHELTSQAELGIGLLQLLIGLAVTLIVVQLSSSTLARLYASYQHLDTARSRDFLKRMLIERVSCEALTPCAPQTLIELRDHDGQVLVSRSGLQQYGPWTMRARCAAGNTFSVQVALLDGQGQARRDRMTQALLDWNHKANQIIPPGSLCLLTPPVQRELSYHYGSLCRGESGSCPAPDLALKDGFLRMCCDDGRDRPRDIPLCPAGKSEVTHYWDRHGDWGLDGNWVTICR